jgi:hypothetical protein
MRGRKLWWLLTLAGLAVLMAGAVVLWLQLLPDPASRITRENFDRIRRGMSRAEVHAILGPPGDYRNGPMAHEPAWLKIVPGWHYDWAEWEGDAGAAVVGFDDSGQVQQKQFLVSEPTGHGPLDTLLWRAKRLWRQWFPE